MVIKICPHCGARYSRMEHNTSFEHDCDIPEASPTTRKEDILVVGNWTDYTGSGGKPPAEVMRQGIENRTFGQEAWLEGEDVETVTTRGNPKNRFRSRAHREYIDES